MKRWRVVHFTTVEEAESYLNGLSLQPDQIKGLFAKTPTADDGMGGMVLVCWLNAQQQRIEELQQRRRDIVAIYDEGFADEPALERPVTRPHVEHAWHLYVIRLREGHLTIGRDEFVRELASRNIGTSVHFIPIHVHPYYRDKYGFAPDAFPVAYDSYRRMLSLPLSARITPQDARDVVDAVLDVIRSHTA
jgi:dTDP-4-amino-4,6-dideoxygalactose transaminase